MDIAEMTSEDYVKTAISHNLTQFRDKPNFNALFLSLLSPFSGLQSALSELVLSRHLDTAKGKQLDGIGDILGIQRPYAIADGIFYFGFTGQSKALGFSQAVIRSESLSVGSKNYRYVSDATYIRLLRWKIIANNSHGTVEDIIKAAKAVFKATKVQVEEGHCSVMVTITRKREDISEAIDSIKERLIPASAGIFVSVNFINEWR